MVEMMCKACDGAGKQTDDEGWQYECSVCHGKGIMVAGKETKILQTDENNRLLD